MSGLDTTPTTREAITSEAEKAAQVDTKTITAHVQAEAFIISSAHPHGHNNSH